MKKLIIIISMLTYMSAYSRTDCSYSYWFAAPAPAAGHGNQPIKLFITNQESNSAIVQLYLHSIAQTPFQTHSIPANGFLEIDLTSNLTSNLTHVVNPVNINTVNNNSILIKSDNELSVVYDCFGANEDDPLPRAPKNTEMFVLKGNAALDKTFFIPSQNHFKNANGYSDSYEQVILVATENNTLVNFSQTSSNTGFPTSNKINSGNGLPSSITLQKGETFQLTNTDKTPTSSFYGLKISANKKIAVTVSDCSIQDNSSAHDLIGDQLIGINFIGKEHLVLNSNNLDLTSIMDKIYILGTENGTGVTYTNNGSISNSTSINEGQQLVLDMNTSTHFFITSMKPVYVYHLTARNTNTSVANDYRDFGSAIVPPIDKCTGLRNLNFKRTGDEDTDSYKISIIKPSGTVISTTPNSSLSSGAGWTTVGGFDYKIIEANNILEIDDMFTLSSNSNKFHVGIHNNVGRSFSYGFVSNFSELNICSEFTICPQNGEIANLEAPNLYSNYQWFINGNTISGATNAQYTANQIGSYYVTANCNGETIQSNDINVNQETDCESQNDDTNEDTIVTNPGPINFECCKTDLEIFNASGTPNPLPVVGQVHHGIPMSYAKEVFEIHRNATIPITELRVVVTDIQYKYNYEDCGKCKNNPALWGTIIAPVTPIGTNGLELQYQPYKTSGSVVVENQNIRELIWSNPNGAMLRAGDQFEVHYLLPPISEIPCCVTEVKICTKISWKDANCCENEVLTCSNIKLENGTAGDGNTSNCECGNWRSLEGTIERLYKVIDRREVPRAKSSTKSKKDFVIKPTRAPFTCGESFEGKVNSSYEIISPEYQCNPKDCEVKYRWTIHRTYNGTSQGIKGGSGRKVNYTFDSPGTYVIQFTPICGNSKCKPCEITFDIYK